jgi:hypothetical protein
MSRRNLITYLSTGSPSHCRTRRVWAEHDVVSLSSPIQVNDGRSLPKGSVGAVVGIWKGGAAYEVEFNQPFHAVVTVPAPKLAQPPRLPS